MKEEWEAFNGAEVELKEIYRLLIGRRDKAVKAFDKAVKKNNPSGEWIIGERKDYGFLGEYYDAGSQWFGEGLGWLVAERAEVALSLHLKVDLPNLDLEYTELRKLKEMVYADLKKTLDGEGKQGSVSPVQIRIGDVDSEKRIVHAFLVFPTEESFVNVFRDVTLKEG